MQGERGWVQHDEEELKDSWRAKEKIRGTFLLSPVKLSHHFASSLPFCLTIPNAKMNEYNAPQESAVYSW